MSIGLIIIVGGLITNAWAQKKGKGMQQYSRNFDVNTVETIQGEVTDITYNPGRKNAEMMGVHLVVKTESESIPVHLGPVWYLKEQERIEVGDKIEVTGSRITFDGAPAMVASTVKRNEMTLRLRDQNGYPAWRGWRRMNK